MLKRKNLIFLAPLLALAIVFSACAHTKQLSTSPAWLAGWSFVAENERVLRLVAESGADDASLAELQTMKDRAGQLPYYFFSQAYTGQDPLPLAEHAKTMRLLYELLLGTQENAWDYADVTKQLDDYLTRLAATVAPSADASFLPLLHAPEQTDLRNALLACFFRGRSASEQKSGRVSITLGGGTTFGQTEDTPDVGSFHSQFSKMDGALSFPLRRLSGSLRNDSLSVLSCAGTFTNMTEASVETGALRGSPGYAGMFSAGGVEAVSLANTHTRDYFESGYNETISNLADAGVAYFDAAHPLLQQADGVSFGLLGYDLANGSPEGFEAALRRDIAAERKQGAQIITVFFDWQGQPDGYATEQQQQAAHLAVDCSADLVVGRSPTGIQGMEIYKEKTIAYSLGGLVLGGEPVVQGKGYALLLRQAFQKNEDGSFTPLAPTILPTLVSSSETENDYTPRPAFGTPADYMVRQIFKLSRPLEYGIKEFGSVG